MQVAGSQDPSEITPRINIDRVSRVPLATQVARQFTWLIATGTISAGSHLPTIVDVARHVGVNFHTVRAAYQQLRDDGLVLTKRGSGTVVLGYDRDRAMAHGGHHPTFTIGVLVPSFSDYYADYLESIIEAATVEGWLPVICHTRHYDSVVVGRYLDQLFSRNVDGVIVTHFETPGDLSTLDVFKSAEALRPFVFVDCADVGIGSTITVDREGDGFVATSHFIEHGHERIGYLAPPETWSATKRLGSGYHRALSEAGIATDARQIEHAAEFSLGAGAKAAHRLLQPPEPPSAIFCAGDILALGAISAIDSLGLRTPGDVAVMGYGEIPFSALAAPALASIRLPADVLAHEAARVLRQAIDDGYIQPPTAVATWLVPRASCGCHPTSQVSGRQTGEASPAQERTRS